MPKIKTNSSCKKRFSLTADGKVKTKRANKRHNMRRRSERQIRENKKAGYMSESNAKVVKKKFMPNG